MDESPRLAAGATTRNEGWLHAGTYHAASIVDRDAAVRVARRTREGYHQTRRFAPAAVHHACTFALVVEESIAETRARWDEAGVAYRTVPRGALATLEPGLRLTRRTAVFAVDDVPIDTTVLCTRLAVESMRQGVRILMARRITRIHGTTLTLDSPTGARERLHAGILVFTAGCGNKKLIRDLLGVELPFRFWRSHLMDLPRVSKHAFFGIRAGEVTCMPHGRWSIVGTNADQEELPAPSFDVRSSSVLCATAALRRLVRDIDVATIRPRACVKVDVDPGAGAVVHDLGFAPPQLDVAVGRISSRVFWALPGKMTEAPVAADLLVRQLCDGSLLPVRSRAPLVASPTFDGRVPRPNPRPIDEYDRRRWWAGGAGRVAQATHPGS